MGPAVDKEEQLQEQAKLIRDQARSKAVPELKHKMMLKLPQAMEKLKEHITKEMTDSNKEVKQMKVDVLMADPLIDNRINEEEKAKQMRMMEAKIDAELPAVLKKARSALLAAEKEKA